MAPRTYRPRYKKTPLLAADGSKRTLQLTRNDEAIFRLLAPGSDARRPWGYSLLRTNYISTLLPRDHSATLERLDQLESADYLYLPEQPRNNFRHLIYALDKKGAEQIGTVKPKHAHQFAHELMENDIAASFELGARRDGIHIVPWPSIKASDNFPKDTKSAAIPLSKTDRIRADWEPFYLVIHGRYAFFPGFEADTGHEPMDSADPDRSSIRKKLEAYLYVIENKIHSQHFGASTLFIPFITTDKTRMETMIELLAKIIKDKSYPKNYAKRFLFTHIPSFYDTPLKPTDWALTKPWQRAEYEPFTFIEKGRDQ